MYKRQGRLRSLGCRDCQVGRGRIIDLSDNLGGVFKILDIGKLVKVETKIDLASAFGGVGKAVFSVRSKKNYII